MGRERSDALYTLLAINNSFILPPYTVIPVLESIEYYSIDD